MSLPPPSKFAWGSKDMKQGRIDGKIALDLADNDKIKELLKARMGQAPCPEYSSHCFGFLGSMGHLSQTCFPRSCWSGERCSRLYQPYLYQGVWIAAGLIAYNYGSN
eukprot:gene3879-13944_t